MRLRHTRLARLELICSAYYAVLDQVWPIEVSEHSETGQNLIAVQIEGWFNINEQHQITEYDFTFRRYVRCDPAQVGRTDPIRWQWATDVIVPSVAAKPSSAFLGLTIADC